MPADRIEVLVEPEAGFEYRLQILIIGAGACGLTAALAARDRGAEVMVLERDNFPRGSTSMSSGMIPASNTRFQRQAGIDDSPQQQAEDILRKNHQQADAAMVQTLCERSAGVVEWLSDQHRIPFQLVTGFLYPGHTRMRMHATPSKTGEELMGALMSAAERAGVDIVTDAYVTALISDNDGRILGITLDRPDGSTERIGCDNLILACCGFGANAELVARYIPEMSEATYFGHEKNHGEALRWGQQLGAALADLGAYQGHASLAFPQQVLITWALMMEGGIQVNCDGQRFANEHSGYSEQAREVLAQPEQIAWNIYDKRIHHLGQNFPDYRDADAAGAVISADSITALAEKIRVPAATLAATLAETEELAHSNSVDAFGRQFTEARALQAPFYAIRVTGALFHTQGGLDVTPGGQVKRNDGRPFPNLFAGGGAARGISGSGGDGYMSGNGLLAAIVLGAICGEQAAVN